MAGAPSDWQSGCVKVKERGAYLLQSGQWSDCTFLVGSQPDQVVIAGHKLILAMASPVFEAMFYGGMAERNDPITISDVQPDAFKALLEYIYTDNIKITSFDEACELCYTANKYMLPHLVKECTKYLWLDLYPKNVCRAYEFACLFEETGLMNRCIQIISTSTKEVLNDSSFKDIDINTVIMVFSLDHLDVDSELDLFEAAERYAKAQEKKNTERASSPPSENGPPVEKRQKSPEPSTSTNKQVMNTLYKKRQQISVEASPEEPEAHKSDAEEQPALEPQADQHRNDKESVEPKEKPTIRNAIEKIRFLTLTPQQFAEGPARSPLLTKAEAFAVLMNIVSSASDAPMPNGFSTSRVPRKHIIGGRPSSNMATFTVDTPSPVLVEPYFGAESSPHHTCMPVCIRPPRQDGGFRLSSIGPSQPITIGMGGLDRFESLDRPGAEVSKIYCQRALVQHTDCLNTSVLDCSVTFMVDKNICLLGVQVPTQAPSEESAASAHAGAGAGAPGYSELLYAHLLDADGARLTYTHYTSRVPYRHLLDIMFNRPVYIQRNKVYKVGIVFNKVGWYPMGRCTQQVAAESVFFNFGIGQSSDSVRDGLIRSIIFTY